MRKLVAALFVAFTGIGAAQAAPDALKCNPSAKIDPTKPETMNCFADEIFVLNGAETATFSATVQGPLVDCADKMGMAGVKDSKNCLFGADQSKYLGIDPLETAVQTALNLIKAKSPAVPEWDEVVVFTADFGPATANAPLFYRAANGMIQPINPVAGIGLGTPINRDATKPYIGLINAGNTKSIPATPHTGVFGTCGTAPRRAVDDPTPQTAPALCAPGLYSYFDSLAQATANLYGPYLSVDAMAFGGTLWSMPAIKTTLVAMNNMGVVSGKVAGGPVTNVWNAFLNLKGSILGGNTFADNGNGTFSVTKPPAFQGVSAPYEGSQVVRFQPIDLYVMGFLPSSEVPPIQSFMHAAPGDVYQPAGVNSFNAVVGPAMGSRLSGVSIRGKAGTGGRSVPRLINFSDAVAASGGERVPGYNDAPQHIRQLWIMVTKPKSLIDLSAADGGAKVEDQIKDQATQLANLQKHRRAFNNYFYMLTGYRGRVYSTFEGNVDDSPYFEFGRGRNDATSFTAQGPIKLAIPGPEEIPNSGGKQLTVLRVTETAGGQGSIKFNPAAHPIRIEGKQDIGAAPNNVLTVRMRVPSNPGLLEELKKDSRGEKGFYATFRFEGPNGQMLDVTLPKLDEAFLVPDGKFRNYSINLSADDKFKAGTWTSFTLIPSNREARDIEIEYIRIGYLDNVKDGDKSCKDADQADGWLDLDDNCAKLYNPDQADGNNDGIGDACEDYDGDNKLNSCDNCPTTTNTSQRDANGNQIGDACDGSSTNGCFFQESAVAGAVQPGSAIFVATLLVFGGVIAGAVRRRRRR
jgi:hypothetical protein